MCIAIPSRIVALDGLAATVECFGVRRPVSLILLDEPVRIGDWVAVQAGGFAVEKIDERLREEALALIAEVMDQDLRPHDLSPVPETETA